MSFLKYLLFSASAAGLCFAAACSSSFLEEIDPNAPAAYVPSVGEPGEIGVVSIHEIIRHKRGGLNEHEILSFYGDKMIIDRNQLLDSTNIISIEAIPIPDQDAFYKLRLRLTVEGIRRWSKFSIDNRDDDSSLAFVIDGIVYRTFKPRFIYDSKADSVIVDGPFDEAAALDLEANSMRNFTYFSE